MRFRTSAPRTGSSIKLAKLLRARALLASATGELNPIVIDKPTAKAKKRVLEAGGPFRMAQN